MGDRAPLDELLDPFTRRLDTESAQRVAEFQIASSVEERATAARGKVDCGIT